MYRKAQNGRQDIQRASASLALGLTSGLALATSACGAGAPLLHPVHPLEKGAIAASAGASAHFAPRDAERAITTASDLPVDARDDDGQALVEGAIAQALSTPGLAPWLNLRVGLGGDREGGISYTGRRARGDWRQAFVFEQTAFSVGAGITGLMPDIGADPPTEPCDQPDHCPDPIVNDDRSQIPGLDTGSISGWGLDVPLLFGWRSQPALFSLWTGVRARFEDMSGEFRFDTAQGARTGRASGTRVVFQGVFGLAVGIKPIWALFEFSPAFERLSGDVNLDGSVVGAELEGFSFSPALALRVAP